MMKKDIYIILITIVVCFLASFFTYKIFTHKIEENVLDTPKQYLKDIPKLDASLVIRPLLEEYVNYFYDGDSPQQYLSYSNKDELYKRLLNKEIDLLITTGPTKQEKNMAEDLGIELEYYSFLEIPLVFFVNKNNQIDNLTTDELSDIYSGKISNWSDLGGNDKEIKISHNPIGTESYRGLINHITSNINIKDENISSYKNDSNEIGYAYYNYYKKIYDSNNVKLLNIDSINPLDHCAKKETYPHVTKYYIVIRKENNTTVKKFKDALLSKEGINLLEDANYVKSN